MTKDKWIWMPHAGHFILGERCRFHLNTYVGKYIVSTIGELWNGRDVREIHAEIDDPEWLRTNIHLLGDNFDYAYLERFGFEEVGCDRKYETMVFKAKESKDGCCPYRIKSGENIDFGGYNTPEEAYRGHLELCDKWADLRKILKIK